MNPRAEFQNTMNFKKVKGRLPAFEWAKWWDITVERWEGEGLPKNLDAEALKDYFELDKARRIRFRTKAPSFPEIEYGHGAVKDRDDYKRIKKDLFLKSQVKENLDVLLEMKESQESEGMITWVGIDGFFWLPRDLFGIEDHLYAFFDHADLMQEMNTDLLEYNRYLLDEMCKIMTPDFITIAEDMSYNHGSMISKGQFDEFIAPYYLKLIPFIKEKGMIPIVDTDGYVLDIIEWLTECGVEGILPLERQAAVDISEIRERYPKFKMIGGFDKTIMHKGEQAMKKEFERILPVMKSGGYIPTVDHQVPPDVSMENFKTYVRLLKKYCKLAAAN